VNGWIDGRRREAKDRQTRRAPQRKRGAGKQTWVVCRKQGCDRKLRSDNRSGFCKSHHTAGGQCQRCLGACTRNHPVCQRCRVKGDQERAEVVAPCTAVGCTVWVHSRSGLCRKHWQVGGGLCRFAGCQTRIVFDSKIGLCREHGHRARTERRQAAKGQA